MNRNSDNNLSDQSKLRVLKQSLSGMETADGAGVKLSRFIGSPQLNRLDPFLLLDSFSSDQAQDYIAGFPEHPHRGFETVTYLLNGRMRHQDSAGHQGVIEPGGVQWMTAARGIVHSEMPEQQDGLLQGFQLWVNLPAAEKMGAPAYQEYSADKIPVEQGDNGERIRVIAGTTDKGTQGPIINRFTDPVYLDVSLPADSQFQQSLPDLHNAFVYIIDGRASVLTSDELSKDGLSHSLAQHTLGVLSQGDQVQIKSGAEGVRFLLIAGRPLNEPVARGGPFVMNTQAEVMQAFDDYRRGQFFNHDVDQHSVN